MVGPDLYRFRELWRQYRACRRNKRNTLNALAFEIDAEANLLALQGELRSHTYAPGRSILFVTDGPKPREVFAADFRDRVVHHLLVSRQEPVLERVFIHDSYACRKGKGTLAASDRLMTFLRCVTANGRRPAWALRLDVANFFCSINKETLFALIARRIADPELLWLTRTVLFHDPTGSYRFRPSPGPAGRRPRAYPVPPHKSLFGTRNQRGLPIGNLTSQFWANVYLNEADHFIKRTLRCRYYVRYVDDMVLLSTEPGELVRWRAEIETFLRRHLRLDLRQEGREPFAVRRGIDFVGWKTWWNRRVPRWRTLANTRQRLAGFERTSVRPALRGGACRIELRGVCAGRNVERLRAALVSYSGHLRHGAAWNEWERLWASRRWLKPLFQRRGWALAERFPPRRVTRARTFREQYWALIRDAGESWLVFCPVGRFIEFRGPQRALAERVLGLRRTYRPRGGFALAAGFPRQSAYEYAVRAINGGWNVVLVREGPPRAGSGLKLRVPAAAFVPRSDAKSGKS